MSVTAAEIVAKCEHCGFQLVKPFPSFEIADDSSCPQCGHDLAGIEPYHTDEITWYHILRPGLWLEQIPRDAVSEILEKAFRQGLDSIDLRVTFSNRYEDDVKIEILSIA
jgi:hypothetical protein